MNRKITKTNIWFAGLCALAMCGCSKSHSGGDPEPFVGERVQIALSGGIARSVTPDGVSSSASLPPTSKAVIGSDYAGTLAVAFARLDQGEDGTWPEYSSVTAPLEATLAAGSGERAIAFTVPQYYLSRGTNNDTRLVGWYPRGTWSAGSVSFTIDGQTDIMLTGELTGNKSTGSRFGETGKVFTFAHKLTRLNIKAYAADDASAAIWGQITANGIVLKEQTTTCAVALPATVTFGSGSADLTLPAKAVADDAAITYPPTLPSGADNAIECGYAMIRPVNAGSSVTLAVTTSAGGTYEVPVTLTEGFKEGYAYDVSLKFTATGIEPTATIGAWEDGGDVEVIL